MKALEILKEIQQKKPFIYSVTSVWCRTIITNEPTRINEAIAELEEAMKPKSCEGCKYGTAYFGTDRKWCEANIQQDGMTTVDKDFCCNRYEAKEQ